MVSPPVPPEARHGLDRLAQIDAGLARVEIEAGPLPWRVREAGFGGLLNAIVGQQISNQAAAAIWRRCCALPDSCTPAGFLALEEDALRAAGLSRPKIGHGRAVAQAFLSGQLATETLAGMGDEEAVRALSAIRGLGVWSAEIYLLFALQRPDVFPAGDLALQAATADLHGLTSRPTPAVLRGVAQAWQPHRALAARSRAATNARAAGRPSMDDPPA